MKRISTLLLLAGWVGLSDVRGDAPKAAVLRETMPGTEERWSQEMAEVLRSAGYETWFIGIQDLRPGNRILTNTLLMIPGARRLPKEAVQGLERMVSS